MELSKLFRPSVFVKPVHPNDAKGRWIVVTLNPLQSFVDDLRYYGWRIAWFNLKFNLS